MMWKSKGKIILTPIPNNNKLKWVKELTIQIITYMKSEVKTN